MATGEFEHKTKNAGGIKANSALIAEYTNVTISDLFNHVGIATAMSINTIKLQDLKNI